MRKRSIESEFNEPQEIVKIDQESSTRIATIVNFFLLDNILNIVFEKYE